MAATQNHKHKETHTILTWKNLLNVRSKQPQAQASTRESQNVAQTVLNNCTKQYSNKLENENNEELEIPNSQLLQRFANHTVLIEEPDVTNTQSEFEPDRTVNKVVAADLV
ncbi:hypothetical protein Lal_00026847 [Lupinus albus]|nr:hypothetical protein Lal_00026847 [Lupinus albus]